MKKILLLTLTLFALQVNAQKFEAGKHYSVLDKPVATQVGDGKIEVRELFWYYCPHCSNIEPTLNNWLAKNDKSIEFVRQPAVFSKRWISGAVYFYVLEELGLVEKLHKELFASIHEDNVIFNSKQDFIDWLGLFNVDEAKAKKAFSSFNIRTKVNRASKLSREYKVSGVPAFVVNGKYSTGSKQAGGEEEIFEVIDYLVAKEKKLQALQSK